MQLINPATGTALRTVEPTPLAETDAAIERSRRAFDGWRRVSPGDRARLLRRFAAVVDAHVEELAALEVANSGHTIGNARWEAGNVRDVLDFFAGAPERLHGKQIPVPGGVDLTFHEPLGVVGVIVPWNFPMPIAGWGFGPALAAGNTVVLKPAEVTPLTAMRLAELALEAGLPEHVFTVLPGKGSVVGQRLVTHPAVRKVCFTGSTEVGKQIMAGCADQVKRVTLELGGKSANIVFADADLEKAAAAAPGGVFDNAGQDCCARSRILVEASGVREVHGPAGTGGRGVPVRRSDAGNGADGSAHHRGTARRRGRLCRRRGRGVSGLVPGGRGILVPPTVLLATDRRTFATGARRSSVRSSRCCRSRRGGGGPARQRHRIRPVRLVLDPRVGRAFRVARGRRERATLSVNSHSSVRYWTPFGGIKQSGLGRELGPDALHAFTEVKNVSLPVTELRS